MTDCRNASTRGEKASNIFRRQDMRIKKDDGKNDGNDNCRDHKLSVDNKAVKQQKALHVRNNTSKSTATQQQHEQQ